ncbi:MAG: hypothetical protein PHE49_10145 [bacterium]|nr:hypothetical protein [bacterium]
MNFSQRVGITPIRTEIQIKSMDNDLKNSLWNVFQQYFLGKNAKTDSMVDRNLYISSSFEFFFKKLWANFFKLPLDTLEYKFHKTYEDIRGYFFKGEWYEIYDFIEFVAAVDSPVDKKDFKESCNYILERELSGYRFVDNIIVPITNENELKEIEDAIENAGKTKLSGVMEHLKSALTKLSDRKSPDYRNSIKESISAVESMSIIISGDDKATLGKALKIIKNKIELHTALEEGFSKLYGYTNDEGGIRHAMIEGNNCDFEDAKYMLVSCSAFINYLIIKSQKAGIKF